MSESEFPIKTTVEELKKKAVKMESQSINNFQRVIVQTNMSYERAGMETVTASGTSMLMRQADESEEEPYKRRMSLKAGQWTSLDLGWIADNVGCVSLHYKYEPKPPKEGEVQLKPLTVGVKFHQEIVPVFEIQLGDVVPLIYVDANAIRIYAETDVYVHIIAMPK
jgi:hypothetical protein